MFTLFLFMFLRAQAVASPESTERFPDHVAELIQKGSWKPTPFNSPQFQLGDVYLINNHTLIIKGHKCFKPGYLPKAYLIQDSETTQLRRSGGKAKVFKIVKAKGKIEQRKTIEYTNIQTRELSVASQRKYIKAQECRKMLREHVKQEEMPSHLQMIVSVLQANVKEEEYSQKIAGASVRGNGLNAENSDMKRTSANMVTIAYKLSSVEKILARTSVPASLPPSVSNSPSRSSSEQVVVNDEVKIQGGGSRALAERLRKAKEADEAKKAFEAAITAKLDAAETKKKQQATQDWSSVRSLLKGDDKSVVSIVEKFIEDYGSVRLSIEGQSRVVSIPELAEAKKWLNMVRPPPKLNGDGYKALFIPAGSFIMGCHQDQSANCFVAEKPSHPVTIRHPFYIMRSEVTQRLYRKIMRTSPSHFRTCGKACPVERVSWVDAVTFANKLSEKEGLEKCYKISGKKANWPKGVVCQGWRLPTEAEWEYAARGGQSTKYAGSNTVDAVAWYGLNSDRKTHRVCKKQKNGFGLCDMSGNVWEWVWDRYAAYESGENTDPVGPTSGAKRVFRGGSVANSASEVRTSFRDRLRPIASRPGIGFRLVRTLPHAE